jgi:choline dehydrogenase-like flavoprotein
MNTSCDAVYCADVIVIGSGAGGAAAAHALAKQGLQVLVLEKGCELPRDGSTLDIDRVVHRGEFASRERWRGPRGEQLLPEEHFNLGGKTKWYGAALVRFSCREFEPEISYGARGWPFAQAELLPYYEQAERLLGVTTFPCENDLQLILKRLSQTEPTWVSSPLSLALSKDILKNQHEAAHFDGFASVLDLKGDAEVSFLASLRELPNVTIRCDAEVHRLLPAASDPGNVNGVQLENGEILRARAIVLAAGALHSPRLLARYVAASNPLLPIASHIGCNLKLHLLTAIVAVSPSRKSDLLRKTMMTVNQHFPHSSLQPLGFDGELIGTLMPKIIPKGIARQLGDYAYGFFLQTEDGSDERNRVLELEDPETGKLVPMLDYDEKRLPQASFEHRRFVGAFRLSLLKLGIPSVGRRIGLNGTAHACGTLIAGHDAGASVVDSRGAVFDVTGLYVSDGSILPRISRVNPALSIYAWGLRLGALLGQQLLKSPNFSRNAPMGLDV